MPVIPPKCTSRAFPSVMGIVNVTPDSFSDGGDNFQAERAIAHAGELIDQGADLLDVGGESSRPGAESISETEELKRVIPVIRGIRRLDADIPISIDTTKSEVAIQAVKAGASLVNDISAGRLDCRMFSVIATLGVPLILMHMQGEPRTMQMNPQYDDVVSEVTAFLAARTNAARECGVNTILADVGIGFGKSADHNWELLRHHQTISNQLGIPMVLGLSRKRFLGSAVSIESPKERDVATALLHTLLLNSGVDIVRVHNVSLVNQSRLLHKHLTKVNLD